MESGYRHLLVHGLSEAEAGNVVAYVAGLRPVTGGWTVREIKGLAQIRESVARGAIDP